MMGSSTRDDDRADVVYADPIQGASPEQGRPPRANVGPLALGSTGPDTTGGPSPGVRIAAGALLLLGPPQGIVDSV